MPTTTYPITFPLQFINLKNKSQLCPCPPTNLMGNMLREVMLGRGRHIEGGWLGEQCLVTITRVLGILCENVFIQSYNSG